MTIILKTKYWQVEPYAGGYGVFDATKYYQHTEACRRCVEEALAGDLEALVAIEMCEADGMLMGYWYEQLEEKSRGAK